RGQDTAAGGRAAVRFLRRDFFQPGGPVPVCSVRLFAEAEGATDPVLELTRVAFVLSARPSRAPHQWIVETNTVQAQLPAVLEPDSGERRPAALVSALWSRLEVASIPRPARADRPGGRSRRIDCRRRPS